MYPDAAKEVERGGRERRYGGGRETEGEEEMEQRKRSGGRPRLSVLAHSLDLLHPEEEKEGGERNASRGRRKNVASRGRRKMEEKERRQQPMRTIIVIF